MSDVVLEDCGYVFLRTVRLIQTCVDSSQLTNLWEVSLAVADQQTRLPATSIANNDELFRPCWGLGEVCGCRDGAGGGAHCGGAHGPVAGAGALSATWHPS